MLRKEKGEEKRREGRKSDKGRRIMGGKDHVRASVKERKLEMDREWEAENERRKAISKTDRQTDRQTDTPLTFVSSTSMLSSS